MNQLEFNNLKINYMPDDMPHFKLQQLNSDISASIRSIEDLFILGMLVDILRRNGNKDISLYLHYLIGSRMDRPISLQEPNTLKVVCDYLNSLNLDISIVFPHSSSTLDRLNCKHDIFTERKFIEDGIVHLSKSNTNINIILPDSGAEKRWYNDHAPILKLLNKKYAIDIKNVIGCTKHRDVSTGKLSGFCVNGEPSGTCIIIDDLIDRGGTFVGLAEELKKKGAQKVYLIVYHSILSGGLPIRNIDGIYTTNSFRDDLVNDKYITIRKVLNEN